jgi:hypothetical protein
VEAAATGEVVAVQKGSAAAGRLEGVRVERHRAAGVRAEAWFSKREQQQHAEAVDVMRLDEDYQELEAKQGQAAERRDEGRWAKVSESGARGEGWLSRREQQQHAEAMDIMRLDEDYLELEAKQGVAIARSGADHRAAVRAASARRHERKEAQAATRAEREREGAEWREQERQALSGRVEGAARRRSVGSPTQGQLRQRGRRAQTASQFDPGEKGGQVAAEMQRQAVREAVAALPPPASVLTEPSQPTAPAAEPPQPRPPKQPSPAEQQWGRPPPAAQRAEAPGRKRSPRPTYEGSPVPLRRGPPEKFGEGIRLPHPVDPGGCAPPREVGSPKVKLTGLAQILGKLQASNRVFHSNCWANLKILGQPCMVNFRFRLGSGL